MLYLHSARRLSATSVYARVAQSSDPSRARTTRSRRPPGTTRSKQLAKLGLRDSRPSPICGEESSEAGEQISGGRCLRAPIVTLTLRQFAINGRSERVPHSFQSATARRTQWRRSTRHPPTKCSNRSNSPRRFNWTGFDNGDCALGIDTCSFNSCKRSGARNIVRNIAVQAESDVQA